MSREQAQQLARDCLAALRYDGSEYFWINDMHPRMVMHPIKPELDGKDVSENKDPNGQSLFKAFVAYQWPKPGSDKPVDKISYVQGFEPWGWVIGTGVYVDHLRQAMQRQLATDAAIVVVARMLAGYLFLSFYRVMDGGLKQTRRHLRVRTEGDLTTSPFPWGKDEAAQLMLELRLLQDSLRGMVLRVRGWSVEIVHSSREIASGACRQSGPRLRGGRRRGARAGAAFGSRGARDQGPDRSRAQPWWSRLRRASGAGAANPASLRCWRNTPSSLSRPLQRRERSTRAPMTTRND